MRTLYEALRRIRQNWKQLHRHRQAVWLPHQNATKSDKARTPLPRLWIDAISINQTNTEERNHQVSMMAKIYSNSSMLLIWLGEHTETEGGQFRSLSLLKGAFKSSHAMTSANAEFAKQVLRLPWFERRWVVQEYAFSPFGCRFILFNDIVLRCAVLQGILEQAQLSSTSGAMKSSTVARCDSMFHALHTYSSTKCSVPLDYVYALRSLTPRPDEYMVDYAISEADLFTKIAIQELGTREAEDFSRLPINRIVLVLASASSRRFVRCSEEQQALSLPSWVSDWTQPCSFVSEEHKQAFEIAFTSSQMGPWLKHAIKVEKGRLHLYGPKFPLCYHLGLHQVNSCFSCKLFRKYKCGTTHDTELRRAAAQGSSILILPPWDLSTFYFVLSPVADSTLHGRQVHALEFCFCGPHPGDESFFEGIWDESSTRYGTTIIG